MKALMSSFRSLHGGRRQVRPGLLIGLFFLCLPGLAWAGGGGAKSGNPLTPSASSPGDEVGSLPFTNAFSGTTLVGELAELRSLVVTWRSEGRISFQRLDGRLFAVTFVGNHYLEFDRAQLARTNVQVAFRGGRTFSGGVAVLQLGRLDPVRLPAERVMMPLGRLAAVPEIQGAALSLAVLGTEICLLYTSDAADE